jgi:hypothetical protein
VALVVNDTTGAVEGLRVRNRAGYPVRVIPADDGAAVGARDTDSTDQDTDHAFGRSLRARTHAAFRLTIQPVPRSG